MPSTFLETPRQRLKKLHSHPKKRSRDYLKKQNYKQKTPNKPIKLHKPNQSKEITHNKHK